VTLHHVLDGRPDGEVVVLASSLGTTHELWEPQLAALTARYRVLRFDHRGHGDSPMVDGPWTVDDLALELLGLLDELDLRRVHVAGISLGGALAIALALAAPERVGRLVLASTSARFGTPEGWHDRARVVREQGVGAIADAGMERWFTRRMRTEQPDVVARYRGMLASTSAEAYARCCEALVVWDVTDRLSSIQAPTLVIAAREDPTSPPEHARLIAARIPDARVVELRGAAHIVNVERPEAFTRALLAGLAGDVYGRGMAVRREVLGDEHVDAAIERTTAHTAGFQDLITRYAWGEVWARPDLDLRSRSVATLAALTSLGREHELEMHVRAARRNGLTTDEIAEVLLHVAVYAGVPATNRALAIAQRVLAEDDPR